MKRLPEPLATHPLATGAMAFVSGACIYTDLNLFGARTNTDDGNITAGTVEYGPSPSAAERALGFKVGNWMENLDVSDKKIGFLMGQGALAIGVGERMVFTELIDDHEFVKEIGIRTIQSVVRSDIFDYDGIVAGLSAGDFYENTSSLVFGTFSPHNLAWT